MSMNTSMVHISGCGRRSPFSSRWGIARAGMFVYGVSPYMNNSHNNTPGRGNQQVMSPASTAHRRNRWHYTGNKLAPCGTDGRLFIVMHHSSTSTYMPKFTEIEGTFCGWTDRWTSVHSTDGRTFETYFIRSTYLKTNSVITIQSSWITSAKNNQ